MFYGCSSLESINLSNFDTHKVKTMDYMFAYCSSLIDLDIYGFIDNPDKTCTFKDFFKGNYISKGKIRYSDSIENKIKDYIPKGWDKYKI